MVRRHSLRRGNVAEHRVRLRCLSSHRPSVSGGYDQGVPGAGFFSSLLVRGGLLRLSAAAFDKDGKTIHFTRAFLTHAARSEVDLSGLTLPEESAADEQPRKRKTKVSAVLERQDNSS